MHGIDFQDRQDTSILQSIVSTRWSTRKKLHGQVHFREVLQIGTCHWQLPSTSLRIKADFQHTLKEFRVDTAEMRHTVLREKLAGQSSDRHFQGWFYKPNSYISHIWKALKSFMVTTTPWDFIKASQDLEKQPSGEKKMCLIACTPSPKSHLYWPCPCLFGAGSQSLSEVLFPRL